jgi:hypothetical protein
VTDPVTKPKPLWKSLDPRSAAVLLDSEGALDWLRQFPVEYRHRIAILTAEVLASPYEPDASDSTTQDVSGRALRTFSERFSAGLAHDPVMHADVMSHLVQTGIGVDVETIFRRREPLLGEPN